MSGSAYELLASIMRYAFLAVLVYLIAVAILRSITEYRYLRASQRMLVLAIRYVEVLAPEDCKGRCFTLGEDNHIGRAEDCELPFPQSHMKKYHARITLKKGEYRFSTKQRRYAEINGQPVIRRETALADGDVVWIQDVCFVCRRKRGEGAEHA